MTTEDLNASFEAANIALHPLLQTPSEEKLSTISAMSSPELQRMKPALPMLMTTDLFADTLQSTISSTYSAMDLSSAAPMTSLPFDYQVWDPLLLSAYPSLPSISPMDPAFLQFQLNPFQQLHTPTTTTTTTPSSTTSLSTPSTASPKSSTSTNPITSTTTNPSSPYPSSPSTPSSSSSKKPRFRATPTELAFLLKIFESNPFPSTKFRAQIAAKLNLTERQVMFWFQNRRSSLRLNGVVAVKGSSPATVAGPGVDVKELAFRGGKRSLSPLSNSENPFSFQGVAGESA
ncbi:hypothetical protein HDU79_001497 [Rhizoclosmatium sp. JEL0117]|nr:hypothetical protein HDU79_001497 [Rhizoclosmatium sp. JEL0117]